MPPPELEPELLLEPEPELPPCAAPEPEPELLLPELPVPPPEELALRSEPAVPPPEPPLQAARVKASKAPSSGRVGTGRGAIRPACWGETAGCIGMALS